MSDKNHSPIRINRYISDKGISSRREADRLINNGKVLINGRVAVLGDKVSDSDTVTVDGKVLPRKREKDIIIAYNKPVGVECTTDTRVADNICDAVAYPERIFPIGRLDKMSEGLILLTNMGEIVNKILRSENNHEKEYIAYLNQPINDHALGRMREGIWLNMDSSGEDKESTLRTKHAKIERLKTDCIRIILTEGKNRQIRRMLEVFDVRPKRLKRIRVLNIELGDLPRGKWRTLTKQEEKKLLEAL